MDIFHALIDKIIPLYILIGLGYAASRWLGYKKEGAANLLIYIISPIVVFVGIATSELQYRHVTLPFITFGLCCLLCFIFFRVAKNFWFGKSPYIIAPSSTIVSGLNFGFPIALIIFSPKIMAIYLLAFLGFIVFDATFGYYVIARGNHTANDSLKRIYRLPLIYATFAGIWFSYMDIEIPRMLQDLSHSFAGTQIVVGMMIVGQSLQGIKIMKTDWKYVSFSLTAKFVVWPMVMSALIYGDQTLWHFFDKDVYQAMMFLSILPMAVSPTVYAASLNVRPEKVATAVFLSTIFSMAYVPLAYLWLVQPLAH
jgi:predicted permease